MKLRIHKHNSLSQMLFPEQNKDKLKTFTGIKINKHIIGYIQIYGR